MRLVVLFRALYAVELLFLVIHALLILADVGDLLATATRAEGHEIFQAILHHDDRVHLYESFCFILYYIGRIQCDHYF